MSGNLIMVLVNPLRSDITLLISWNKEYVGEDSHTNMAESFLLY